jgi:hypothetical protein
MLAAFARIPVPGSNRMYRIALDFCYMLGVERAAKKARPAARRAVT